MRVTLFALTLIPPTRRYFFLVSGNNISGDKMLVSLIRAFILYVLVFFCMRLMGKRQLGELQPTELVITILVSAIVAVPMQENSLPLGNSIIAVLLLVSLEIINSALSLKSPKLRSIFEGNSMVIIRDGVIDQKQLKRLRFSADDLLDQLRQKDVFDINDVRYAIIETNGQLSVMLKPEKETVTAEMIDHNNQPKGLLCMVVNDGVILHNSFKECNMTDSKLEQILKEKNVNINDIFFMLADSGGNYTIVKKEDSK